jgi:hypothetical protein
MESFTVTTMRKKSLCGDTLDLFSREDQNYHWSRYYWYYAKMLDGENNKVWISIIVLAGCVAGVFECKDVVTWCVNKIIYNIHDIPLHNSSHILLAPSIFREMLKLPEPNLVYKGEEARNFLKRKNNGLELLQEYLHDPATMTVDISII